MTGYEWLSLAAGFTVGSLWQYTRPGGILDLRIRLRDCLNEIWRKSNHPAGRGPSNVLPLQRGPVKSV